MANTFLLEIITPTRKLLSLDAEELTAPGELGEFGILPGHMHFFSLMKAGAVSYKSGSDKGRIVISNGYAEVGPEKTILLVDNAMTEAEINIEEARTALLEAQGKIDALLEIETDESPALTAAEQDRDYAEALIEMKEGPGK